MDKSGGTDGGMCIRSPDGGSYAAQFAIALAEQAIHRLPKLRPRFAFPLDGSAGAAICGNP